MNQESLLPREADARRLDDEMFACAWEEVGAEDRALLKTAIAWHFHRFGRQDGILRREISSPDAGFGMRAVSQPAPWAIGVLDRGFASPARLLAELVPALLAGVPRILVVSEHMPAPALLVALELAGMEDVFLAGHAGIASLPGHCGGMPGPGRLILFCGSGGTDALSGYAGPNGLPIRRVPPCPRILLLPPSGIGPAELRRRAAFCHPDALLLEADADRDAFTDAVFGAPRGMPFSGRLRTLYGEGMEACWTGPGPDFFRNSSTAAFLTPEDDA